MSLPNRGHSPNPPIPKLFLLQGRPGFEWDPIAQGVQPGRGDTPTPLPTPSPPPLHPALRCCGWEGERRGSGNLTWRRLGRVFPEGPDSYEATTQDLTASHECRAQSTLSSPSPSPQPAGTFRKEVHLNSFFSLLPTWTASRPGAPPPPTSAPGRSPAPTRYQQLVSPTKGPLASAGRPELPTAPPKCARAEPPGGAPTQRARPPTAGISSPSAPGQGHGVLVPEPERAAFLAPACEARGPPAARRSSLQLSPLTCSSGVDF